MGACRATLLTAAILNLAISARNAMPNGGARLCFIDASCRRVLRRLRASNRPGNCVRCFRLQAADLAWEHEKCASSPSSSP